PAHVKIVDVATRKTRALPGGPFIHSTFAVRAIDPPGQRILLLKPPRAGSKSDYNDGDLVIQEIKATMPGHVIARNVIPVEWSPSGRRILILRPREVSGETVFVVAVIAPGGRNEHAVAVIDEQDINGV